MVTLVISNTRGDKLVALFTGAMKPCKYYTDFLFYQKLNSK